LHGANASGRPFTGDASGEVLFKTLHKFGFANYAESRSSSDDTRLINCRITNAVKCLPPLNKPNGDEVNCCNRYLRDEISQLPSASTILALGTIAHRAIVKALLLPQSQYQFSHLAEFLISTDLKLIDSYHCSRYNINTGRLTLPMFDTVFERIRQSVQ
jgi:uracil-DNA glycosylase family 4